MNDNRGVNEIQMLYQMSGIGLFGWVLEHSPESFACILDMGLVVASDPVSNGNKVCGRNTNNKNMDKGGKREAFC